MLFLLLALQDPLVESVREYLARGGTPPKADIAAVERAIRAALRPPPPKQAGRQTEAAYTIAVPAAALKADALPLLISIPDIDEDPAAKVERRARDLPDVYVLAPRRSSDPAPPGPFQHGPLLACLADALKRYPIDPDAVWIEGSGDGAGVAWDAACLHPDRFAALAPGGGCPTVIRLESRGRFQAKQLPLLTWNLRWTPVRWTMSGQELTNCAGTVRMVRADMASWGYAFEYSDRGGAPPASWLEGKRRIVDPAEVRYVTYSSRFNRAWWIEMLDFSWPEDELPHGGGSLFHYGQSVAVTAAARSNTIELTSTPSGVRRLRIWLNSRIVDFDKLVVVRRNGRKLFDGRVQPSVQTLLDDVRRRGDPSLLYCAEITLNLP